MPRKTKFSDNWLELQDGNKCFIKTWCRSVDVYSAECFVCKTKFSVSNMGFRQILSHADGAKHKRSVNCFKNQTIFTIKSSSESSTPTLMTNTSSSWIPKTILEKTIKAETVLVLTAIKNIYSFASLSDLASVYSEIFDDSIIAKNIKLSDKKVRYVVNFGLAPYFKALLYREIANSYFVLLFDETTTKQVKKQLDIYVSFWSEKQGKTIICYCESHFSGHAEANKIVKILLSFIENNGLSLDKLIQLSMDGPKVNLAVMKQINSELSKQNLPVLLDLGTCCLHIMHGALCKGINKIDCNVDGLALEIHQWFKQSPARREDYHFLQLEILEEELARHNFLHHVESRWLTLGPVCERNIEQYDVLKEYFIGKIPKESKTILPERYYRIVKLLKDPKTLAFLHFISFYCRVFEPYLLLMQKAEPLVHVMYTKLSELLRSILLKFLKAQVVNNKMGVKLLQINLDSGNNWLESEKIEVGHGAKTILPKLADKMSFLQSARSCYLTSSKHLFEKLPLANPLLKDLQCLLPYNRKKEESKNWSSRLIQHIPHVNKTSLDMDKMNEEWILYMCEDVTLLVSAYEKDQDICKYWNSVFSITDLCGYGKYLILSRVVKACLSLSNVNAQPERGFSTNNYIVTKDKTSLSELTVQCLRTCRDVIRMHGNSVSSIPFTKELMCFVQKSHAEYASYMEKSKTEAMQEEEKRKAEEEAIFHKKKLRQSGILHKMSELEKEEKSLLDNQHAAQKLLDNATKKIASAISDNNMSDVKVGQMMLSAANVEIVSVNTKLTKCCIKQSELKDKMSKLK